MAASASPINPSPLDPPNGPSLLNPLSSLPRRKPGPALVSMAFQPIVDLEAGRVIAYEALARGHRNEPASAVLFASRRTDRAGIHDACQLTAVHLACSLGVLQTGADLSINISPRLSGNGMPSLAATASAAQRAGLPLHRLIFEITEGERLRNPRLFQAALANFREQGLRTAIDDFGAGYAGLSLLNDFQPDIIKLDIALTRDIADRPATRIIVRSVLQICRDLNIQLIAEGIEQPSQAKALQDLGVRYMQGHHFAAPGFESLPAWPA